jgi:hypothetical protein
VAAIIFQQLWEELRVWDLNQEVALVSIELAEVLTKQGEAARAADLAAGCYSIMRSWGLHKDALAAWIVFQESLHALQDGPGARRPLRTGPGIFSPALGTAGRVCGVVRRLPAAQISGGSGGASF